MEDVTSTALASSTHASGLELRDLLGHLLDLLRRHRLIDYAQKLLLVRIDQCQQLRVLLAQLLQQQESCIKLPYTETRQCLQCLICEQVSLHHSTSILKRVLPAHL